jgi:hypothetical protein
LAFHSFRSVVCGWEKIEGKGGCHPFFKEKDQLRKTKNEMFST